MTLQYGKRPTIDEHVTLKPQLIRTTEAVRLAEPPALDGRIDAGEYDDAPYSGNFRAVVRPAVGDKRTRFCVGYDDAAVYIAVVAEADDPASLPQVERGRDGDVRDDDLIELFFDANHDHESYGHLVANLYGDRYDAVGGPGRGKYADSS